MRTERFCCIWQNRVADLGYWLLFHWFTCPTIWRNKLSESWKTEWNFLHMISSTNIIFFKPYPFIVDLSSNSQRAFLSYLDFSLSISFSESSSSEARLLIVLLSMGYFKFYLDLEQSTHLASYHDCVCASQKK